MKIKIRNSEKKKCGDMREKKRKKLRQSPRQGVCGKARQGKCEADKGYVTEEWRKPTDREVVDGWTLAFGVAHSQKKVGGSGNGNGKGNGEKEVGAKYSILYICARRTHSVLCSFLPWIFSIYYAAYQCTYLSSTQLPATQNKGKQTWHFDINYGVFIGAYPEE